MKIYCDSVILMYFLDYTGPLQARVSARFAALQSVGDQIAVNDLSRLECRVKPIRFSDKGSLAQFDAFFARSEVQFVPLTSAAYDRATDLRAVHNFKLGDALHLAAAIESGCGAFLTNDLHLRKCTDIPIEILP